MGINELNLKDIKSPKDFCEKVLGLVWKEGNKGWPPKATTSNSGTLAHGQVFADDNVPLDISSVPKGTVVNDYHAYCKYVYVYLKWLAVHVKQNDSRYQSCQTSMMRNFLSVAQRLVDKLSTGDRATLSTFIKKLDEWIADSNTASTASSPQKSKAAYPADSDELTVRCFLTGDEAATDGSHLTFSVGQYANVGTLKFAISRKVPSGLVGHIKDIKIFKNATSQQPLESARSLQPILVEHPDIIMKAVIPGYKTSVAPPPKKTGAQLTCWTGPDPYSLTKLTIRIVSGRTTAGDVASQVADILKLKCASYSLRVVCGNKQLKSHAVLPDSVLSDSENSPLHIYYPTGSILTSEILTSISYHLMAQDRKILKRNCSQNVEESCTVGDMKSILRARYSGSLDKGHIIKIYADESANKELADDKLVCDHKGDLYIMMVPPKHDGTGSKSASKPKETDTNDQETKKKKKGGNSDSPAIKQTEKATGNQEKKQKKESETNGSLGCRAVDKISTKKTPNKTRIIMPKPTTPAVDSDDDISTTKTQNKLTRSTATIGSRSKQSDTSRLKQHRKSPRSEPNMNGTETSANQTSVAQTSDFRLYRYRTNIDGDKVYKVKLGADAAVKDLKEYLRKKHGSSDIANIKVLFAGKDLLNDIVLENLNIGNTPLHIYIRSEQDILLMTAKALRLPKTGE